MWPLPPDTSPTQTPPPPTSTRPWAATLRAVVVATAGLLPLLPQIAAAAHVETVPVVVAVLGAAAAIQRVIAIPAVRTWVLRYAPWNWTTPETYTGRHRR